MHPPSKALLCLLALLTLSLGSPTLQPFSSAHAKQDGAAKGKDKGQAQRNKSKGEQDQSGKPRAASEKGSRANQNWNTDWDVGDFLAAGFTGAVLQQLIDGQTQLLNTGAKPLPPGIEKRLASGKPLPPGIAARPAGDSLRQVLPHVEGHSWEEVGVDLVLVEAGTQIVRQVLRDVLR